MVLLVGGSFFEDVWYADGGPFPDGAKVAQIEASHERLAYGVAPGLGLVGSIRHALAGLVAEIDRAASADYRGAARQRNKALAVLKDKENAVQKARAGGVTPEWLSVSPLGGMVEPGESLPVSLTFSPDVDMYGVYTAYKAARAAARETGSHPPPLHIRNAPTKLMKEIGYGAGYAYDHDAEDAFSGQNYFPDGMRRPVYYAPPERGFERELKKRIDYFAKLRAKRDS
jgi:hypothetical protein